MRIKTSAELFAERGDEWNTPNWQEPAGPILREVRTVLGQRRGKPILGRPRYELDWMVDGHVPVAAGPRAAIHKPEFVEPKPAPSPRPKIHMTGRPWQPVGPVRVQAHAQGVARPLTEEQLQLRARQRAAEKARLTRAHNRVQAQEEARLAVLRDLLVKVSQ